MSRIEIRNSPAQMPTQSATAPNKANGANGIAGSSSLQSIFELKSKRDQNRKISAKRLKRLHSASDISEADLQPLLGKKRDEVIGELSRIWISIQEFAQSEGEDETTKLCTMMLDEQIRRLTLVQGVEVSLDDLRGNA